MRKLAEMEGVRGGEDGFPVELWRGDSGETFIVVYNEAGYNSVEISLDDLLSWLRVAKERGEIDVGGGTTWDASATPLE